VHLIVNRFINPSTYIPHRVRVEPQVIDMSTEAFPSMRDWALSWIRGSIESYLRGKTPINIVKGRIKRAIESYGIKPEEVSTIISLLQVDPSLTIPRELREERAKPLLEFIENLEKGEKSG